MDKFEEMRLRIRACEQAVEWAEDFRASEDEIWDILRDMAEHKVALRLSEEVVGNIHDNPKMIKRK